MNYSAVQALLQDLVSRSNADHKAYQVSPIPGINEHRVGVVEGGHSAFFIKCKQVKQKKPLDINLALLYINFDRECEIITEGGKKIKGNYTIVALKNESYEFQSYFIGTILLVLKNFTGIPTVLQLSTELSRLIEMFTALSRPPQKTVQGLWAELLLIAESKSPQYAIKSWHSSKSDKYDFNDGTDKIEVKSTSTLKRVHRLSFDQLYANKGSELIIASVFVIETGMGKNIFDLVSSIEQRVKESDLLLKVNQMLAATLGSNFENASDLYFDYSQAKDSLKFYDVRSIPVIPEDVIPKGMSNISFDFDFSYCKEIKVISSSKLHKAIL